MNHVTNAILHKMQRSKEVTWEYNKEHSKKHKAKKVQNKI